MAETSMLNERLGVVDNLMGSICEYAEIKLSTVENLKDTEEIKTAFQLIMDLCSAAKIIITEVQKELPNTNGSKVVEATRKSRPASTIYYLPHAIARQYLVAV